MSIHKRNDNKFYLIELFWINRYYKQIKEKQEQPKCHRWEKIFVVH